MEGVPKTEGHRYAVYTFSGYLSGKVKPIMVLDPRAQKVTYTPLGVEWLKEHGYFYLPPYAEATHIVSSRTRPREGQSPELVMIPYRPSRPPEEILSEISSARQTETYRLRDIDIRDVPEYQGEYGDISPIMPKLSRYIPECQTFKGEIKLTQHSRNSLMYEVTMNLLGLE
jgi:hypothetical protein